MSVLRKYLSDGVLFVLLIAAIVGFSILFVSLERWFYFWDFGSFQKMTNMQMDRFHLSRLLPVKEAIASLQYDYNLIFTLPLIPIIDLLGEDPSRSNYVISLALVYYLPYAITIGLIAQSLIPSRRRAVFWSAVLLVLIAPAAWLPTLRGYPDTGGALFITLAILVFLYDQELGSWWQIVLIGFFLALAPLFRRHYVFGTTSFLLTMSIVALIRYMPGLRQKPGLVVRGLVKSGTRIGLIGIVSLAVLWVIGRPFLTSVLTKNYLSLYSSWMAEPLTVFYFIQAYYGWIAIAMACLGLIVGALAGVANRRAAGFIGLFAVVASVQWFLIVRQPNPHYSLHFTFAVLLGWVVLVWSVLEKLKRHWRAGVLLAIGAYFGMNAVFWLVPQTFGTGSVVSSLFTRETGPLRRPDYPELERMINWMYTHVPLNASIYVVDSSVVNNFDLLISADAALYPNIPLNILHSPEVDSRDYYALETLLEAEYVILSTPLQIHLARSEQGIVSTVYEAFTQNWEVSKDYIRLPVSFTLMDNVKTNIYKRIRPTNLEVAIATLARMEEGVGAQPGTQMDWIQLDNFSDASVGRALNGSYWLQTTLPANADESLANLIYLGAMPEEMELNGNFGIQNPECSGVELRIALAYSNGAIVTVGDKHYRPGTVQDLHLSFDTQKAPYLLITLSSDSSENACQVSLKSVTISGAE